MELISKIFVIMPFGRTKTQKNEWNEHFDEVLKLPIARNDFPVQRSEPLRKDILNEIIKDLILSKIVLADITGLNPNVMWELGVRQSFRNGTVVIARDGTKLPFDITTKSVLKYPKKTDTDYQQQMEDFTSKLNKAIKDCKDYPDTYDSHVLEIISGRGTIFEVISRQETIRKLDALIDEIESNIELSKIAEDSLRHNSIFLNNSDEGGGAYPTRLFRTNSIELLLTTRYLIKETEDYLRFQEYFENLGRLNHQIGIWRQEKKSTTRWLKEYLPKLTTFNIVLEEVKKIKQQMEEQI